MSAASGERPSNFASLEDVDEAWRPLRRGVLKCQDELAQQGLATPIQVFCDRTAEELSAGKIVYVPETGDFRLFNNCDVARSGSTFPPHTVGGLGGFGGRGGIGGFAMPYQGSVIVSQPDSNGTTFWLGYNEEPWPEGGGPSGPLRAVVDALQRRFEAVLHIHLRKRRCRMFARVRSPTAECFSEIPADVFAHFAVSDWKRGVARSEDGEKLFSIHISGESQSALASSKSDLERKLAANTKASTYARYLVEHARTGDKTVFDGTWRERRTAFCEEKGFKKDLWDEKTLRKGRDLAVEYIREE